ncbi:MAG: TIGR01777 family oxidoreductase [Gammaproteobacteria bacterium]
MKIIIAGGTGFVGRHLIPALLKENHEVSLITRDVNKGKKIFPQNVQIITWDNLKTLDPNQMDAVINLAGENIGEKFWTKTRKEKIKQSRIHATKTLAEWCARATKKPHLYNTSAIGVYGLQTTSSTLPPALNEETMIPWGNPSDFLSEVGQAWEIATRVAESQGVPVTITRFAVVLHKNEGVLKKLSFSFKLGLGGPIGSGQQAFTWVHIDDLVRAFIFLLNHPELTGAFNICAPECVTQKEFARVFAKSLHRPAILTTPAWALKLIFGQMADELLLAGQHVYPKRLLESGFQFSHPKLEEALMPIK